MTKNIFSIAALLTIFLFSSCNDMLDDINTNPNKTSKVFPPYLLSGTQKQAADLYWGSENNFGSTLLFVQHWAAIQYPEVDRYQLSNTSFTSLWNIGYATLIKNMNDVLGYNGTDNNDTYRGVALIMRSWTFQILTDAYGDIPYTEAGKNFTPAYDSQRDVYLGLIKDLDSAKVLLTNSKETITGDLIYKGSTPKWIGLANSLQLRIALRIADREPTLAKSIITKAASNPNGLINSNENTFRLVYLAPPQDNPIATNFRTRQDYRVSETLVKKLSDLSDPRLSVYASLPDSLHYYVGVPNAGDSPNKLGLSRTSRPGDYFRKNESPAVLLSYAETLFGLSEAVARGFIDGSAEDYYNQAIKASLNQFGISDTTAVKTYLAQPNVKYDPANFQKSIGEQKWIALYGQGMEAFAEWRRLGYPQLKAGPASVLNGKMPIRFFYPGTEQTLNGTSYKAAINRQGDNLLTTPLWFFKKN